MRTTILYIILAIAFSFELNAQQFTYQDSLRGMITPEREWWDLTYYHLDLKIDPERKHFDGSVDIQYRVLEPKRVLQVDLQPPLQMTKVTDSRGNELMVRHEGNAHFVTVKQPQRKGDIHTIRVHYSGTPTEAARPPWDGGITWQKDQEGNPFIHSTCQGIGASIWWPCKDHMYDEVDSMLMSITVPQDLMNVSNGQLRKVDKNNDGTKTYHWFVNNPLNNYGVNINIANYAHFEEVYEGEKGLLQMDYYVLPYNLEKAKVQFKDAVRTMQAFEYWFGPYPFYEDGFKLVEVSYPGMEHQSSVTYGNGYANGYVGNDGSGTGHGFLFDFIIVHETGHEWFANNITYKDVADMWIHESFTNYSESLFLEYHYGKEIGQEYVRGTRKLIKNDRPIIGIYDVNHSGSGDMYVKGGNMLNTIRTIIRDDEKWRAILRGLNEEFYHQTVSTQQIEDYMREKAGIDLAPVFDQYLRDIRVPQLEYYFKEGQFYFRWGSVVNGFDMPIDVTFGNKTQRIYPKAGSWNAIDVPSEDFSIDPNYYIGILQTS
ncbi:M1 family metallopeptidase [Portibacter marinus]|uniref:M1 family metallopeptidase n=1 Tax=Portibacter marinus TaxID=2898660 RepID=UPI001F3C971D|nr:M1 family metallopeptidase [Portibacter marinus]